MKYPAFALTVNPAAPVVSQGQLVLGAGEREKWYLPRSTYKQSQGGNEGRAYRVNATVLSHL